MGRMQKHIVPFLITTQHLAGEVTPPHHSLCWSHTQPPPAPSTHSGGLGFCRIHRIH